MKSKSKKHAVDAIIEGFAQLTAYQQQEVASELLKKFPAVFKNYRPRRDTQESTENYDQHLIPLSKLDIFANVNDDQKLEILSFLDGFSLLNCRAVSSLWKAFTDSKKVDTLWKNEYFRLLVSFRPLVNNVLMPTDLSFTALPCSWLDRWKGHLRNRQKWMKSNSSGTLNLKKWEFPAHTDRVRHVRIRGDKFVSASWDGTIRLGFLSDRSKEPKEIISHRGSVFGVWFDGRIVTSCSEDNTVCIYDTADEKLYTTLRGHQGPVYRIELMYLPFSDTNSLTTSLLVNPSLDSYKESLLISCSSDFIGVWDWLNSSLLLRLTGHKHDVHRLQVRNNKIITGSYDQTIKVWEINRNNRTSAETQALQSESLYSSQPIHRGGVSALHATSNLVGSGSAHGDIFILDISKKKLIFRNNNNRGAESRDTSKNIVTCVMLDEPLNLFICCSILSFYSGAGQVCFWEISSGVCLRIVKQQSYINSLKFEYGLLFSAESDGCIRIRDLLSKDVTLVGEEKLSRSQLFDVDVQGESMVACGLTVTWVLSCE